jgi:anti-sigma regulatory factor (Ser/Thr protein kinase)
MIDLSRNRAELLAEIEAAEFQGEPLNDLTDPRVANGNAHVRVQGHAKKDLFPLLKVVLSARFALVPRSQLNRDLLIPLRNAIGNAYKHGNAKNPDKVISVGMVLSRVGALVTITDEGSGFDVAGTFRRFQLQEDYCMNRGAGFLNLHQATSTVSYENGGRTMLLCFRPTAPGNTSDHPRHVREGRENSPLPSTVAACDNGLQVVTRPAAADRLSKIRESPLVEPLHRVLDAEWIRTCLSSELPEFRNGETRIESCRVYAMRGPAEDGCGNRFVIRVASNGGHSTETRILTGKLHATETAAEADFESAKCLHDGVMAKRLLIPRPVARLKAEPRLVLYEFDPWINLQEYLTHRPGLKPLLHAAERAGKGLADVHRSQVTLGRSSCPGTQKRELQPEQHFSELVARAEMNLATLPSGPGLVNRLRVCVERIQDLAALSPHRTVAPIHGALDWDCIHFGADGRFYLYHFESCRRSDPGLDLGGFAADLLCFTIANHSEEAYRNSLDAFLNKYNAETQHPMGKDDLRFYIARALIERLGRADCPTKAGAGQLLGALDAESGRWERAVTGKVPS